MGDYRDHGCVQMLHRRRGYPLAVDNRKISEPALVAINIVRLYFEPADDWEDRYRYVLELGRTLEPMSEAAHSDANKVRGCVSQVWLELGDGANATGERVRHYRGDSDSHLVRGLIAIALALYSDRTVGEILSSDAQAFFRELGLEQHLTPQRSNGVRAMIERIRADAAAWGWAPRILGAATLRN